MTPKWFRLSPSRGCPRWHLGSRLDRAALYVALCSVFVLMLSASSMPHGLSAAVAGAPAPRGAALSGALAADVTVQPARAGFGRADHADALAALIARKYRVSEQATRDLVAAAYREGLRNGVDPLLLLAVIAIESRFNPIAQSDGGAMGLMQVVPHYHADKLGAIELASVLEPHMNIQVGARILKEYITRGGNEVTGLQLYNGASADASNSYANRVLGEKQWLQDAIRRTNVRARA